jgi:hypothetical protein
MPEPVLRLTWAPDALAPRQRFVVVARADELAAGERLLAGTRCRFSSDARRGRGLELTRKPDWTIRFLEALADGCARIRLRSRRVSPIT